MKSKTALLCSFTCWECISLWAVTGKDNIQVFIFNYFEEQFISFLRTVSLLKVFLKIQLLGREG